MLFAGPPLAELPPAPLLAEGPAPEPTQADDKQRAAAAFEAGEAHFAAAEYEAAARSFAEANALISHPDTLYNLALSHELAGNRPAAWTAYRQALEADPSSPRDMSQRLAKLTRKVGVIELHSEATAACVDGVAMAPHQDHVELAVEPGSHELYVDGTTLQVDVTAGSTRALYLDRAELLAAPEDPRGRRTVGALSGLAAGTAILATGLGVAAAVSRPNNQGFIIGATTSAAAAAGLSIAAIVVSQLAKRDAPASASYTDNDPDESDPEVCPPLER